MVVLNGKTIGILIVLVFFILSSNSCKQAVKQEDSAFITYSVDPKNENIQFFWKNDSGEILGNIKNLKEYVEIKNQSLVFAMNGGMFKKDFSPQGLFIQHGIQINSLDTTSGEGNFYMKPNGVFYITSNNIAQVCETDKFKNNGQIKYATQSGPMLLVDGEIHPAFKQGSSNLNIRNGVGILPDNKVVFVMSKKEINFYDFANFFKSLHCKNALYLDGFVSRTYLPEKNWTQMEGELGVIIGVTHSR